MKPERILCVIGKNKNGGAEKIVFSYCRCLDKEKFAYDFIYEEGSTACIPHQLLDNGARAFQVPSMWYISKYFRAVKKIIKDGNYRIIHTNINTLSVFALFAAKRCGVKIRILHNHSMSSPLEKKRDIIKKILRPWNKRAANVWCSCSVLSAKWMYGEKAVDSGKVKILNNGVDVDAFRFMKESRSEIRQELGLEDKAVIGHIGRFVGVKNHIFIINCFEAYHKKNRNSTLVLVGDGELMLDVREYVKSKNLTDSVVFTGHREDTAKLYSAFDAFVLPSLYEGFPVVVVEAAAADLPILLSENISRECKISEKISFLPIDSPVVWAEKLSQIDFADRKDEKSPLSGGSYDIENCTNELEKLYTECLEKL